MAAISDYLKGKLGNDLYRTTAYTKPTIYYFALMTAAPTDAGGGTEVSGGAYVRASLTKGDAYWEDHSGVDGIFKNAAVITFPTPTVNWGTVTHVAIYDASTSGNLLLWGALDASSVIASGDNAPRFSIEDLQITIS